MSKYKKKNHMCFYLAWTTTSYFLGKELLKKNISWAKKR